MKIKLSYTVADINRLELVVRQFHNRQDNVNYGRELRALPAINLITEIYYNTILDEFVEHGRFHLFARRKMGRRQLVRLLQNGEPRHAFTYLRIAVKVGNVWFLFPQLKEDPRVVNMFEKYGKVMK